MSDKLKDAALIYHQYPTPGKVRIQATKPLINQRDLALAYSPGVAAACEEIDANPETAALYTSRSNLVAVITNGTAVLGLGNIGPLASKPVMEGKAILFKHFADVDAFDIEINETDVDKLVDIIASLEPTIGGINLEDIKAPECFEVEKRLKEKLNIPVFHDDQHGTAIVTAAAVRNALKLVDKKIEDCRLVVNGAGAAAIACTNMLVVLGLQKKNIMMLDRTGVIHAGRDNLTAEKQGFVVDTEARTLDDAMQNADIFLGLSVGNVLSEDMLKSMAKSPIILAMANPTPEVMPDVARRIRPDCVIATGRSDFPNQVNNVLCFPFLFRGALDVGASTINDQMKLACVNAIADIALAESSEVATSMYSEQKLVFGYDYILPKPFDHRLITSVAGAVAQAAMDSGVATRQIDDMVAYRRKLQKLIFRSGTIMKPLFEMATNAPKRVLYTSGENEQVLRAVQVLVDDKLAKPVLIGRRTVIEEKMSLLGLRFALDQDVELIDPSVMTSEYFDDLGNELHEMSGRNGVSRQAARRLVQSRYSILGNLLLKRGEVDALLVGPVNRYGKYLSQLQDINGLQEDISVPATMQLLTFDQGTYFIADTGVTEDPDAEQLAEITMLAANKVRRFGFTPKVALLSSSNYGSRKQSKSGLKMRKTLEILKRKAPDLEVDGEMNADVALDPQLREAFVHDATLKGRANLLIMPNLDAANITYKALKVIAESVAVGPILLGIDKPAHIIENNATSRSIVNLSTLAVVDAGQEKIKVK